MVLLGDEAQVEARFGLFGESAILDTGECTIGLELILDAPMDLLGDVGHVESRFSPF